MAYPKLSVHIVTWNSMRFLPDLLKSIMDQTYRDFNVLVIDNASTDGVEAFLREHYPDISFIRNARNLGFSAAHNQGIRYAVEHWPHTELQEHFILACFCQRVASGSWEFWREALAGVWRESWR